MQSSSHKKLKWWRIRESNSWPLACKASALANWANSPEICFLAYTLSSATFLSIRYAYRKRNLMAGATGLEPATSAVTVRRSNQNWATPPFLAKKQGFVLNKARELYKKTLWLQIFFSFFLLFFFRNLWKRNF